MDINNRCNRGCILYHRVIRFVGHKVCPTQLYDNNQNSAGFDGIGKEYAIFSIIEKSGLHVNKIFNHFRHIDT
jgi:hypothetical protein